ncbi:MAG: glutamyl-tRNA reductase [Legionellaceae bacterium]|nr:glutamyl-tRNA reductase [Legionellaceae bacterium]
MFIVCGLNHTTAPIALREQCAIVPSDLPYRLQQAIAHPEIQEVFLLSTCNRTELYAYINDSNSSNLGSSNTQYNNPIGSTPNHCTTKNITQYFANTLSVPLEQLNDHLYIHAAEKAHQHLLRVASGLDSMMLGESQIFKQLKQAIQIAEQAQTIGRKLKRSIPYIFHSAKQVRRFSGIGEHPVSLAYCAIQHLKQHFTDLKPLSVMIIGSGETASLVAHHLLKQGVSRFFVASRTIEHAAQLAYHLKGHTLPITDIATHLHEIDVLVSATTCPIPFITKALIQEHHQNTRPLCLLDLAIPRDVEPEVASLPNLFLYNIDDLQSIAQTGLDARQAAAKKAEQIIEEELARFHYWLRSIEASTIIRNYRERMQTLADDELARALQQLATGKVPEHVLQTLCTRLLKKLMHFPTQGLRQIAWDGNQDLLTLAHHLYSQQLDFRPGASEKAEGNDYEKIN